MINVAVAFFAVDLIARRYVDGDKRLLVLLLLLLTPLYQFHGQRFSTNQILLSTWPIATYCFLRSFESRSLAWSAAAGAAAALAVLGKYYSILLVAGFVVAALTHPRRLGYLRSAAPWVSTLVALIVLAPHLHWFLTTGGKTLAYARQVHGGLSMAELLGNAVSSVVSATSYVTILIELTPWSSARTVARLQRRCGRPIPTGACWSCCGCCRCCCRSRCRRSAE